MAETTPGSVEDVRRLGALARIEIPEEKLPAFATGFEAILAYVGKLSELNLPVEAGHNVPAVRNVAREDTGANVPGSYSEKIIAQFPERNGNSLSVKQILNND